MFELREASFLADNRFATVVRDFYIYVEKQDTDDSSFLFNAP